ncbi:MAG: twin-arginine translocase subunit TatC [Bacteroidetes bacterium]|nr:MAG: twin-arginine translocase subunit TatC [Bacteroidota bacterium]
MSEQAEEHNDDFEHDTDEKEMTFLDHLEELRWRIVKALMGVVVGVAVAGYFADWLVIEVVLRPGKLTNPPLELINTIPYGQITFYMMVVIVSGLIMSMPWLLYQIWKFIQPGLMPKEQKYISSIVFFTSLCFMTGVAFAYFIMMPYMLQFFATFGTTDIRNMISVNEYMSFVLQLVLISGLIFELPMVAYFLARLGILTPAFMRHYRKHAVVAILILAAVVTPTTDPVTMSVFSFPILILYELSIWIAGIAVRKRNASQSIG